MKLTPEQEQAMHQYPAFECAECGNSLVKAYCGRCDLYYNVGHSHDCSRREDNEHNHT